MSTPTKPTVKPSRKPSVKAAAPSVEAELCAAQLQALSHSLWRSAAALRKGGEVCPASKLLLRASGADSPVLRRAVAVVLRKRLRP